MYSDKIKLDKFYTKPEIAIECLKHLNLNSYDEIIEPSAGNGSFSKNIKHSNLKAFDIDPEEKNIAKKNWFDYQESKALNVLVIGNPPFGKRNKLSQDFIKKALSLNNVKTIAFILPDVYNKYTLQKIFIVGWRLKKIIKLQKDAFTINDFSYHVPCSFFIFDFSQGENLMFDKTKYLNCKDFEWCSKENADLYLMGAGGKIKLPSEVSTTNRGYYIKSKIEITNLKENLEKLDFTGYSSANGGVSWLTKPEIIQAYLNLNIK